MEYIKNSQFIIYIVSLILTLLLYFLLIKVKKIFRNKLHTTFRKGKRVVERLDETTDTLLKIILFLIVVNIIFQLPLIKEYAHPVLKKPILDTETVRISLYSFIKGIFVFYILLLITKIIRYLVEIYLVYKSKGKEIVSSVDILIYNFSLILIVLITLSVLGISWKLLIPIAGALGIGIGFGIQDIVNNFVSGFIILFSRTVKRGDWITLGDKFGKIVDIGIRTSTLRTLDNIDIIIPNSHLISGELINWSYTDNIVRLHIPVGVSYSSDVEKVKRVLLDIAYKSEDVLEEPPPEVRFVEFGDSALKFELLVWVDVQKVPVPLAKSNLNYQIWHAFKKHKIQIPFPQQDIWFKNELVIKKD